MDIQSFVSEHGTFTLVLLVIIIIYIGYTLYWFYSRRYSRRYLHNSPKKCLNKEIQQKIANDIQRKLKEIDSCDCKDTCKLGEGNIRNHIRQRIHMVDSPMSSESSQLSESSNSSASESAGSEKFGNNDFY